MFSNLADESLKPICSLQSFISGLYDNFILDRTSKLTN